MCFQLPNALEWFTLIERSRPRLRSRPWVCRARNLPSSGWRVCRNAASTVATVGSATSGASGLAGTGSLAAASGLGVALLSLASRASTGATLAAAAAAPLVGSVGRDGATGVTAVAPRRVTDSMGNQAEQGGTPCSSAPLLAS